MVFREGVPVTDHVQAIIELLKGYHTPDDLRRIANAIYPESWDRMPTYVLRETNSVHEVPGGLCLVCGALIPNDGLIRHAAWHSLERGNGR